MRLLNTISRTISELDDDEPNEGDPMVLNMDMNCTRGTVRSNRRVRDPDVEAQRAQEDDADDTDLETDTTIIRSATGATRLGVIGTTRGVSAGLQVRAKPQK